jgi:deazaflavin-dependent oxidoreductase (nitroreductase family)
LRTQPTGAAKAAASATGETMATDYETFTKRLIGDMRANSGHVTTGPMAGRNLMILTTKGARSGQDRSAIVTYTRDGDRYAIAGSKGGASTHPAWYHNLKANPLVTVEVRGEEFRARAIVTSGPERDRLWEQHATELPGFREYPKLTDRVIPMVLLERIA